MVDHFCFTRKLPNRSGAILPVLSQYLDGHDRWWLIVLRRPAMPGAGSIHARQRPATDHRVQSPASQSARQSKGLLVSSAGGMAAGKRSKFHRHKAYGPFGSEKRFLKPPRAHRALSQSKGKRSEPTGSVFTDETNLVSTADSEKFSFLRRTRGNSFSVFSLTREQLADGFVAVDALDGFAE